MLFVCKMHEDKKIEIINIQYNSLAQCTVEFLHWVIQVVLKLFCLKVGPYRFTKFIYYNLKGLTGTISASESFCSQFCRWQFIGTMQITLTVTIMQVPTSVAIMQFFRFFCSYSLYIICMYKKHTFQVSCCF